MAVVLHGLWVLKPFLKEAAVLLVHFFSYGQGNNVQKSLSDLSKSIFAKQELP